MRCNWILILRSSDDAENVGNIVVIILTLPHKGIVSTIYLISRLIYKSELRGGLR